jgi:NAD(P)-dependent dehydrogenase (short-subunit alcohol dehydrogenase family)
MQSVSTRGTFVVSRACIPHLKRAVNPHILTLSPPVSLEPRWLGPHVGYTIAKYGMTAPGTRSCARTCWPPRMSRASMAMACALL